MTKKSVNFPDKLLKQILIALNNYRLANIEEYMSFSKFVSKICESGLELEFYTESEVKK